MKKKISFLIAIILLLPMFAFVGCKQASSFEVFVYSSWIKSGSVSGSGTYKEGHNVVLTANALSGSHFVSWIFQGEKIIENDDTFTITNQENADTNTIQTSTLTFVMSEARQGKYTAVFDDEKMFYTKLQSYKLEADQDFDLTNHTMSLSVSQGADSSLAARQNNVSIETNTDILLSDVENALQLSATNAIPVAVDLTISNVDSESETTIFSRSLALRGSLRFANNVEIVQKTGYTCQSTYASGVYNLIFKFNLIEADPTSAMTLTLTYKNLGLE